jgi:hypothetical protein
MNLTCTCANTVAEKYLRYLPYRTGTETGNTQKND